MTNSNSNSKKFYSVVLTNWNNNWSETSKYCFLTRAEAQAFADSRDTYEVEEVPQGSNTYYHNGCEPSGVDVIEGSITEWDGTFYVEGYELLAELV